MALRIVLVALVACLGVEFDSNPNVATERTPGAKPEPVQPSTAIWIKKRLAAAERAFSFRKPGEAAKPTIRALGVAGTSLGWPNILAAAAVIEPAKPAQVEEPAALNAVVNQDAAFRVDATAIELVEATPNGTKERDIADALFDRVMRSVAREFDQPVVLDELEAAPVEVAVEDAPVSPEPVAAVDDPAREALEPEPGPVPDVEISPEPVQVAVEPQVEVAPTDAAPLGRFSRALRLTGLACEAWADMLEGREPQAVTSHAEIDKALR